MHSLTSTDEAVSKEFIKFEDSVTVKIAEKLKNLNVSIENANEKIHLTMNILQSFAHEYVFDKHEYIDYDVLKEMVTETLINLFTE